MSIIDRLTTTDPATRPLRRRTKAPAIGLAVAMLLAACSSDSSDTEPSTMAGEPQAETDVDIDPGDEHEADDAVETDDDSGADDDPAASPADSADPDTVPGIYDDRILGADIWDDELRILSANMGFDGVIGWPDEEFDTILAGGGSYFQPDCSDDPIISGATATTVENFFRGVADDTPDYDDGLPIVFTWPVLTSTVHPEDFLFTLNNGDQVVPNSVGMVPNYELNERNTIVAFGDFGNRLEGEEALYVERLEIVDDGTPLTFLGPDGEQSGVGLTWDGGGSPYDTGPTLVGAKLNAVGDEAVGEGGVQVLDQPRIPNDEFALYGGGDYRLRMLTSGGYTPTGITGLTPDAYEDHFVVHATAADGSTVLLTEVGVDYEVAGGTLRVLGLADLGRPEGGPVAYDFCYAEDVDNQIDIILAGDEAAARSITHVEVPAEGDYLPLYNPGGPGPEPFPDVRYTAPSPPDLEPVIIALDDPMRVSNVDSSVNATATVAADGEIVITSPGLYPEGLTHDPVGDRFIIGSLVGGQLLAIETDGSVSEFAPSLGGNVTGVEADVAGDRLLAAVAGIPGGTAQLSVHDLTTGDQLALVDFASVLDDDRRFANGIAVGADGTIYVTDTGAGVIYAVDSSYTPSVFADVDAFEPDRSGPTASGLNGIVAIDGALIVGHSATGELLRVSLSDPSRVDVVPTGVDGMAIDGLHLSDDGSTLAVVSNVGGAVHLFESNDGWTTATEVSRFETGATFPTSATDVDGDFYVLNGHFAQLPDLSFDTFEIVPVVAD